jgi:hypothetical protein
MLRSRENVNDNNNYDIADSLDTRIATFLDTRYPPSPITTILCIIGVSQTPDITYLINGMMMMKSYLVCVFNILLKDS